MTFDAWWFLLLPLVFALGWLGARTEYKRGNQERALSTAYAKGLDHLLNERHDQAIEAFVEVVRIDPEKSELHFALGGLFRRRGEIERALRVHQSLAERSDLPAAQRDHARFELGQDYLRAGLLDRAEDAFNRLAGSEYARAALAHRLNIAQMVRDWPLAIELAGQLGDEAPAAGRAVIAHFQCEQALAAQARVPSEDGAHEPLLAAREKLNLAAEAAPDHPRPWVARGELALAGGDPAGAIEAWSRLAECAPRHVALVAGPWIEAHEQLGRRDEGIESLQALHEQHPAIDILVALHRAWVARDGAAAAHERLRQAVAARPGLLGLRKWLESAAEADGADTTASGDRALIEAAIARQAERLSRFVCRECGFSARRFYWQCPGCNRWDTYTPRRAEEV